MILHQDKDVFAELIQTAAAGFTIPEVYVEKDYWLTRGLKLLSESDYAEQLVFKGGTALSKAHKLINRFSEDIDLAAKCCGVSANKTKQLLRQSERIITDGLTYVSNHPKESKGSKFRRTVATLRKPCNKN